MDTTEPVALPDPRLLIDGVRRQADGRPPIAVRDPASGAILAHVPRADRPDIDEAVAAASRAFESGPWARMVGAERGRILLRLAERIRTESELLARLESMDTGKPLRQARGDVAVAARYFEYYAGVADKILGTSVPLGDEFLDFTIREADGVSAQIVPWNYPLQISSRGVAPALAVGCTVVLKPSSEAPLSALRLGELALEAGVPAGVLNVITGTGEEAGAYLAGHPGIAQLTFTGSVEAGIKVAQLAARNVVPVTLELGGKSPNIVFADADLARAIPVVTNAVYQNAGQTCSAGSRLLVQREVLEEVVERVTQTARSLTVGRGIDDPDVGPLISRQQRDRVESYVELGLGSGARVLVGGARPQGPDLEEGNYYLPTVLDRVDNASRLAQEEVFGPVLAVIAFADLDDAIRLANQSPYGLIAGVWTRDINRALLFAKKVRCGQVFVNSYGAAGGVEMPFGGYKRSGYGREKGLEALASYTQVKNVCIRVG